jgi:hypothetical protein
MHLPANKQALLENIANDLKALSEVAAIIVGGSYAEGMASDTSDLDIGIYYTENKPFDPERIRSIAKKYAVEEPTVTAFYEWGPWVNGGAWIKTQEGKVDFLYRNIEQVTQTISKAKEGIWENHFEQQPPYGFSSIIYLAETQICIPLYDPQGIIERLKSEVRQYPQALRTAVIKQSLWSAEFTIWHAEMFAEKKDVFNTVGCLARATKSIITTLFAINEIYPIGDKRAIERLEKVAKVPEDLREKVAAVLCTNTETLHLHVAALKSLHEETVRLSDHSYQPLYQK